MENSGKVTLSAAYRIRSTWPKFQPARLFSLHTVSTTIDYYVYEKVGFLENRCNTVKKADTVAQPLRERFQKLKTVVTKYV
jgi:hypothetical protein